MLGLSVGVGGSTGVGSPSEISAVCIIVFALFAAPSFAN